MRFRGAVPRRASGKGIETRIAALTEALPSLQWHWDAETDILGGSFRLPASIAGLTGSVELTDQDGAIVVLDVSGGAIRGLDVVVWPPVEGAPSLIAPPGVPDGVLMLGAKASEAAISALELDTPLRVEADARESVFHLRIGERPASEVVRLADRLLAELDGRRRLAGFWLLDVPPFPA